jgi:hypothetical protein
LYVEKSKLSKKDFPMTHFKKHSHKYFALLAALFISTVGIVVAHSRQVSAIDTGSRYEYLCQDPGPDTTLSINYSRLYVGVKSSDTVNGVTTTNFDIDPEGLAYFGGVYFEPDNNTDVGNGNGVVKYVTTSIPDGEWFVDHKNVGSPGYGQFQAVSAGDPNITFSVDCRRSEGLVKTSTHLTIPLSDQVPDPPSRHPASEDEYAAGGDAGSDDNKTVGGNNFKVKRPAQSSTGTQQDEAASSMPLLNDDKDYTKGSGTTLWLKPTEGTQLDLQTKTGHEIHSFTVKTIGDKQAVITVASTPHDVNLRQGAYQKVDLNGDGVDDVSISLVSIEDGQAGLKFVALTQDSRQPKKLVTVSGAKSNRSMVLVYVVLVGALVGSTVVFVRYRKKHRVGTTKPQANRSKPSRKK